METIIISNSHSPPFLIFKMYIKEKQNFHDQFVRYFGFYWRQQGVTSDCDFIFKSDYFLGHHHHFRFNVYVPCLHVLYGAKDRTFLVFLDFYIYSTLSTPSPTAPKNAPITLISELRPIFFSQIFAWRISKMLSSL